MKKKSNLHTHTTFSDGRNTPEENVLSAIALGMDTLGFSDHSYTPCDESYCMKKDALNAYRAEINALKEKYAGKINILCGLEFDYFSSPQILSGFDYFLGASHYVESKGVYYSVDHTAAHTLEGINKGFNGSQTEYVKSYFENITACARLKPLYIAHFDLPVKYGVIDETDALYRDIALQALDAVTELGVPVEVNTGAMAKGIKSVPYPSDFLLKRVSENGGKVFLGSDCHFKEKLLFAFDEVTQLLKSCGIKSVLTFENGSLTEQGI